MFQLEFKNVAIIKFEIGTIINIDIMTNGENETSVISHGSPAIWRFQNDKVT